MKFRRSKAIKATRNYKINIKLYLRLGLTLPGAFFAERNSFVAWRISFGDAPRERGGSMISNIILKHHDELFGATKYTVDYMLY